jgi:osmotically inducible protein OsmC
MAGFARKATAVWTGGGKDGRGNLSSQSGVLSQTPYAVSTRFGDEKGTNPEELIAAAHAGCFSMALAFQIAGAGHAPERLETNATVSIVQEGGGWRIDAVALDLKAKVPGISRDEFQKLADAAKANCPVSKVLNAAITLKTTLE